ncbi:aminotransferase class V-fold PLP-dependent enzyme [Nostoc sp.]|uniref:aminotransferase class V-fold PLP-dependent enzyme n=1 Tax=Nostoc sp. TaxID=1180 RepID=UPI002FF9D96C
MQYRTQPDGSVSITEIEDIFKAHQNRPKAEQIKLVTITGASTITGYKPPIYEIAALAHRYGAKMFADVCQLIQHERVDMHADDHPCHLDFVAFSGHKIYASYEPIPLIIFVLQSLSLLRTENEKSRFSSTFYEKK